jgi:uncharacterized membrane protein YphA (DoxX/SURF4 family)
MNLVNQLVRNFVGILFIFSGLIKLNDPIGTQIKLEEYFEVFATDLSPLSGFFHLLIPLALYIAVFLCVSEVVLGVALLFKYKMQYTLWTMLLLIIFFTFLTFYSAYFNKVTDCGCFGDAIKLAPWQSFFKDVVLLLFVLLLFVQRSTYPIRASRTQTAVVTGSVIVSVGIAVYAILFLPIIDFLPYRKGSNIPALMKPSAKFSYKYIMEKEGKTYEFREYPSDTTYQFKEMVLLNPEVKPKITDYAVWNNEGDFTQNTFTGNKLLILVQDVKKANAKSMHKIAALVQSLKGTQVEPLVLTASDEVTFETFRHEYQLAVPYYFTDATVLKTMIRSNPGLLLMSNGTVKGKWPAAALPDAEKVNSLVL